MNKNILIVEDEFIVADDLQLTLQQAGYNVCGIAASVIEAREIIQAKKPELVLLDIHLKGKLNGIELAKELKEQNIAFVYLSANSNQPILEAAKATEPYGFLVKPFREKDLLVAIDIAFYRHEHSLEARWRREMQLQNELADIADNSAAGGQTFLDMARVLQRYIPFDLIAGHCKSPNNRSTWFIALLRIGFDEYQPIGFQELAVITGKKKEEIQSICINTPMATATGRYNENDFRQLTATHPLHALLAQAFGISSAMMLPMLTSDSTVTSLTLYKKVATGYSAEQLDWLSRLHRSLTAIVNSISVATNELNANKYSIVDKETQTNKQFEGIIGNSSSLLNILNLVSQVAPLDTSVLILGESGTGKEKIAECIHHLSPRKNKSLVKINCAAFPPTLIESELFGHEKGAFTGATEKRTGRFEQADGGTIFLDEIGDMHTDLQVKLLRVLQEKEIERIGGTQTIKVNVRVIAATNRNLESQMAEGRFRLDLYYRLNVFPITLPPLRNRQEDIAQLATTFAERFSKKFNKSFQGISEQMLTQLETYRWPGNIRELENIIEQSVILNDSRSKLQLRQPLVALSTTITTTEPNSVKTIEDIKRVQRETEIAYISQILVKTHGRIRGKNGAAELLNEKPTTLESRMAKLGIKKEDFR